MTDGAVSDEYRGKWGCAGGLVIASLIVWAGALRMVISVFLILVVISGLGVVAGWVADWLKPSVLDEQWRASDEIEYNEDASGDWE